MTVDFVLFRLFCTFFLVCISFMIKFFLVDNQTDIIFYEKFSKKVLVDRGKGCTFAAANEGGRGEAIRGLRVL